jgi:hypothetical protein
MTRNAKPGSPKAVDEPMGAPPRFWGDSIRYSGKKIEIALYLDVFLTRSRPRRVWHVHTQLCKFVVSNGAFLYSREIPREIATATSN